MIQSANVVVGLRRWPTWLVGFLVLAACAGAGHDLSPSMRAIAACEESVKDQLRPGAIHEFSVESVAPVGSRYRVTGEVWFTPEAEVEVSPERSRWICTAEPVGGDGYEGGPVYVLDDIPGATEP
jgi:hypothetical protein